MEVSLSDLTDLYVYCVLQVYPMEKDLGRVYTGYVDFLLKRGINPQYDNFLTVYHAGEAAREATKEEQVMLLKEIGIPRLLDAPVISLS